MHVLTPVTTNKFLVLGAGELGISVLRELVAAAEELCSSVTVLLRPTAIAPELPEKQRLIDELREMGINLLAGDVVSDSEEELASLMGRFDVVVSCLGFVAGAGTQLKLTRAALKSGVKRYVPWQFGVDYDAIGLGSPQNLFDEQLEVRGLLRAQSHMEWVIISTGMFTSFLFEPSFGVVDLAENTVRALGSWDTAVTVTTSKDIGLLTAKILGEPKIVNQIVYTAGDTLTYAQLADTVDQVLNRTVTRVEWSLPKLKADLATDPNDQICKYRAVFAEGKGVAWDKNRTFNAQHQIELTTVAQWVEQNLR